MKRMLTGAAITATMVFSLPSQAEEQSQDPMQTLNLFSAVAGCYVDTPAWDVATPGQCEAISNASQTTAVFSVLGIDQSSGRYAIQYLDNTCASIFYTVNEGLVCTRTIRAYQFVSQRVQITDTVTGQSYIQSATAHYEKNL
ncbi:hypothetical protein [Stigmatella aurantiaca]|nr:hypothetical protein [Stigmatella aurantiaca]EAU69965.1 hypothetical protein STIAU_5564 [Stigmatella aurantiaca DW4/3-1]